MTVERDLELTLKLCVKASVMLSCTQHAIDHGNQGDMSLDSVEAPQLVLIQPLSLAFFVIDFNGPAMTANTSDASCLPA